MIVVVLTVGFYAAIRVVSAPSARRRPAPSAIRRCATTRDNDRVRLVVPRWAVPRFGQPRRRLSDRTRTRITGWRPNSKGDISGRPCRRARRRPFAPRSQVVAQRPVVDVVQVEPLVLVEVVSERPDTCHMPVMPGRTRRRSWSSGVHCSTSRGSAGRGPDDAHLAAQHVPQLGQLVDRQLAQEAPDAGDPRVVGHLEQRPVGLVAVHQLGRAAARRRPPSCAA